MKTKMDSDLRDMLLNLDAGSDNDIRSRMGELEGMAYAAVAREPVDATDQGVDDNGILRTLSNQINLQKQVGTANGLEINWWLPLTLADDDVTVIYCACLQTISGIKYLYVGGTFTRIGGVSMGLGNIGRYNFATRQWEAVNGGVNDSVYCIAFSPAEVLYIGGVFLDAGGDANADHIAKDNSGSWINVNGGVDNNVFTITWSPADVLYIGGQFHDAGSDGLADFIAKDNGAGVWVNVNGGLSGGAGDVIRTMIFAPDGTLYVGGLFANAGGDSLADNIARTTAAGSWENVGGGLNDSVLSLTFDNDGNLIANGTFTDAGGVSEADRVALFDGMSWLPFSNGGGLSGLGGYVWDVVCDTDTGTIYAGGDFDTAGTIKTACIAAFVKPLADALDMIAGLFEQYQARATAIRAGDSSNYTPTITGVTNVAASSALVCYYLRVGTTVTVFGGATIDPTATGLVVFRVSLPVASNFAVNYQCVGSCGRPGGVGDEAGVVDADVTNDEARVAYTAAVITSHTVVFRFSYQII